MAEIKKYLDTVALGALVDQIKAEDAKVKAYVDKHIEDAGKTYDAAGAAATAESNAKAYTDQLANGQVATNKADIAKLNGDATTEGSVAKAIADAKALVDADVEAVEAIANQNKTDIAAINNTESGILAQAKGYTDSEVAKVQGEVDNLETYVGVIPETAEATNIVAYVQEKTAGIATDTALEELTGRVAQAEVDIEAIEKDYLVEADKTELEGKIATAQSAAETAQGTANTAKAAIDAFLLEADATEKAVDTLKEIQAELAEGEASAASMLAEINALKAVDNATQAELDAALATVNESIGKKADQTVVDGIEDRVEALEAIDVATKAYADQAEADAVASAKTYSDGLNTAMNTRVEALESIDHDHTNKAELDLIATGDKAKWDAAAGKAHEHSNLAVLEGITSAKVTAWDAAEGNAKTFAQGLNDTMQGVVDGIDERVSGLEEASATHALASDLTAAVERIAANETAIATNTSAINSFTAITPDEVNALFA